MLQNIISNSLLIIIDAEYNIKAISERSLTYMYSGLEKGYDGSYVNKWLNVSDEKYSGVFEKNLFESELLFNKDIALEEFELNLNG